MSDESVILGEPVDLEIERLGARGEGVASGLAGPIFVPFATPGDCIRARVQGERGEIETILTPSVDRIAPFCAHFATCGGCSVQTVSADLYSKWKRELVVRPMRQAGVDAPVAALVDVHGEGRRRASFHARRGEAGMAVGFMRARTHDLVEIDSCPLLAPNMAGALDAARAVANAAGGDKPLDLIVTASDVGLDIDLRGHGPAGPAARRRLIAAAEAQGLARLALHGDILIEREAPALRIGRARVVPPPGAFLQATRAGEEALAQTVVAAVGAARRVADLFCGVGTFALRLAETAHVHAAEIDGAALAALQRASREANDLRPIETQARNLFRRPLTPQELADLDAVVFDPPRSGAEAQASALAASTVPCVVAISCSPATFARDAALLIGGGYRLLEVRPFDQFRASAHVEIIGVFEKAKRPKARGRLLG